MRASVIDSMARHSACIGLNPDALAIADALDKERKDKGVRGPLHGIPVLIKDNIDTADKMMTTAGSLALWGSRPSKDSTSRKSCGKPALSSRKNKSQRMGQHSFRPLHQRLERPRRPDQEPVCAGPQPVRFEFRLGRRVSANLCAAAIGTETDGSIVCLRRVTVGGIKPTVGLVSRTGIIPISHTQDGAGPMCRTVATPRSSLAPSRASTSRTWPPPTVVSIPTRLPAIPESGWAARRAHRRGAKDVRFNEKVDKVLEDALDTMKSKVRSSSIPLQSKPLANSGDSEFTVLLYELKADLNAYLARLGPNAPVKTLKDIIDFNERNREKEMPYSARTHL